MAKKIALLAVLFDVVTGDNVLIRPWGDNALRIQISPSTWSLTDSLPTAYLPGDSPPGFFTYSATGHGDGAAAPVTSGNLKAEQGSDGLLTITRISDSKVLLQESPREFGTDVTGRITFDFSSSATKVYGMGQNRHADNGPGLGLMVVNESYSFQDSIAEEGGPTNSLPWALTANPGNGGFQFGVLFNSPALGGVTYTAKNMSWWISPNVGNQSLRQQFDFLITTHAANASDANKPFQIIEKYVDAVGHARKMPWPGYWHSKNRYSTQQELLDVARGFHNRSIPVDVIVIDWFHWKIMGDWSFNSDDWPDPKAMVDECHSYGMEIMVSVWAFSCPGSRSYDTLTKNNWVTTYFDDSGHRTKNGIETHGKDCRLVDPTTEEARNYVWSLIETGYYNYGIKIFWLDASEPEGFGPLSVNASWSAGAMLDMGSMFTLYWTQAFYDGLQSHGETDIVLLPRAGWVGTWRHGGVLWSGDIGSTMDVLRSQVNIGLSAQASGIPWWTTDVGGYHGGNAEDPVYREIIVRWFQYGMTCPMLRQHGARDHTAIWYYGPTDEKNLGDIIKLRAAMKPYISAQLDMLNATGRPFNRPLMWDFPNDPRTWELAEGGIGDPPPSPPQPVTTVSEGDWVVLAKCNASCVSQQWLLNDTMLTLPQTPPAGMCMDNGGTKGKSPPEGPYTVHMWGCAKNYAAAQKWTYTAATKQLRDTQGRCMTTGDGTHVDMVPCATASNIPTNQEWEFKGSGAMMSVATGGCVGVVSDQPHDGGAPVADQYMMGDGYMAAPILNLGQFERNVYFPVGADWKHHYTSVVYKGGTTATVPAPLAEFPLFQRVTSAVSQKK